MHWIIHYDNCYTMHANSINNRDITVVLFQVVVRVTIWHVILFLRLSTAKLTNKEMRDCSESKISCPTWMQITSCDTVHFTCGTKIKLNDNNCSRCGHVMCTVYIFYTNLVVFSLKILCQVCCWPSSQYEPEHESRATLELNHCHAATSCSTSSPPLRRSASRGPLNLHAPLPLPETDDFRQRRLLKLKLNFEHTKCNCKRLLTKWNWTFYGFWFCLDQATVVLIPDKFVNLGPTMIGLCNFEFANFYEGDDWLILETVNNFTFLW
jgi:hypothetical protein